MFRSTKWALPAIALVLVLLAIPTLAGAASSGTCGAEGDGSNVTWTLDDLGVLTISGTGAMQDYSNSNPPWRWSSNMVYEGVVEEGVTNLGDRTFRFCTSMAEVSLPSTLHRIGSFAFQNTSSLESITIPAAVTEIDNHAFMSCEQLTDIHFGGTSAQWSDISIGMNNFALLLNSVQCSDQTVQPVTATGSLGDGISFSLTPQGDLTITGGGSWDTVALFPGVSGAFNSNGYVRNVVLQPGVTEIDDFTFSLCSQLKTVTIPTSVSEIGAYAFNYCTALTDVYFTGTESEWAAITVGANNESLTSARITYNYVIPQVVDSGVCGANGNNLTWTLYDNGTLKITGAGAMGSFYPDYAPWLDQNGCNTTITRVAISQGITDIGTMYFYNCQNLTDVTIPSSVGSIGYGAFSSCTGLTSIIIPDSVTNIDANAFDNCSSLAEVLYTGSQEAWNSIQFGSGNDRLLAAAITCNYPVEIASGICGAEGGNLSWTLNSAGLLTISGEGAMADYIRDNTPWESYKSEILAVAVEPGVTSIGSGAFKVCSNLTNVTISSGVTSIGDEAFRGCSNLTDVAAPSSVTHIGDSAFFGCSSITEISLPGVTSIASFAFYNCEGLTAFVIPDGVTEINPYSFAECYALTRVTVPSTVVTMAEAAFSGSGNVVFIIERNSDLAIVFQAILARFAYTDAPDEVIGWAESGDYSYYDMGNNEAAIVKYHYSDHTPGSLTVPAVLDGKTVVRIGREAFRRDESRSLINITLPGTVTEIDPRAFEQCFALRSINLPEGLVYIGTAAFAETDLQSIELPDSLQVIESYAFLSTSLSSVTIPGGVTVIEADAFSNIGESLTSVTLLPGVKTIGCCAFSGNSSLASVTIPKTVTSIADYAFQNCYSLAGISLPNSLTSIGAAAFYNCYALTSVTLPNSLTCIESATFDGCSDLRSIIIPDSVTSINMNAFSGCYNLAEVRYTGSQESWSQITIGEGNECLTGASFTYDYTESQYIASGECGADGDNVTWTLDGDGVMTISGSGAMANIRWDEIPWADYREMILTVVVEPGVTSIGNNAFYTCQSLMSVTLPNTLTRIGGLSFSRCQALTSISLPDTLTHIGGFAFESCTGLTSVTLPGGLAELGEGAFAGSGLTEVLVQAGTDTRYEYFYEADKQNHPYFYRVALPENTVVGDGPFLRSALPANMVPDFTTPASLTTIEAEAFYGIDASFIWLTDNVTSIGERAFAACEGLQYIRIPYQCTSIGTDAIPEGVSILCEWGTDAWNYANANNCEKIPYGEGFN